MIYHKLVITADSPDTEIWLSLDGHLVQKEVGLMKTSLEAGEYIVQFGLGDEYPKFKVSVPRNTTYTQSELEYISDQVCAHGVYIKLPCDKCEADLFMEGK